MPSKSPTISVFLQLKNDAPSGASAPEKILVYRGKQFEVIDKSTKTKEHKGVSTLFQLYHLRKHIQTTTSVEERQNLLAVAGQIQVKKRGWFIRIFSAIQNLFCGYGLRTSYGIYRSIEEMGKKLNPAPGLPKNDTKDSKESNPTESLSSKAKENPESISKPDSISKTKEDNKTEANTRVF